MKSSYDVAVVGAGPAGSFLAYLLAKEKFKVILIDKEKFPREKICAGGLTAKVFNLLPFDISPLKPQQISKICLVYKMKKQFIRTYRQPLVYTINRAEFDNFLAQKAQKAGAYFLQNHRLEKIINKNGVYHLQTKKKLINAKIVVGADGANSIVSPLVGFRPDTIDLGLQFNVPLRADKEKFHQKIIMSWGSIPKGYAWVFPKKDSLAVGVGGPKNLGKKLKIYLDSWLDYLEIKNENLKLTGHLIPHRLRKKSHLFKDNIVLIGDAGGLNDSLTGEGIFYALKSAKIAAKHIKDFLSGNKIAFKNYEKEINQEIMPELKATYFFNKTSVIFFPLVFRLIEKNDYFWKVFCRLIRGDKSFLEVKKQFRPDRLIKKIYALKREISISSK